MMYVTYCPPARFPTLGKSSFVDSLVLPEKFCDRRQSIRESMTLVVVDTRTLVLNRGYLVRVDCFSRRSGKHRQSYEL